MNKAAIVTLKISRLKALIARLLSECHLNKMRKSAARIDLDQCR
jgi:hypothetical protein